NRFYVLTNDKAKNFRLLITAMNAPTLNDAEELLSHRSQIKLERVEAFVDHLVVFLREEGLKKILIITLANRQQHYVRFNEPLYTVDAVETKEFNTTKLRFVYASLVSPKRVYDYDMAQQQLQLLKTYVVQGPHYAAEDYQMQRRQVTASDGTKIPVSLVYK